MAKVLWCTDVETVCTIKDQFLVVEKKKCMAPVVVGTEQCAAHKLPQWVG